MSHERTEIDWLACELIERIPAKVSGRPIVGGTRILPNAIVNSFDAGGSLEAILEDYSALQASQVWRLFAFAHDMREQPIS